MRVMVIVKATRESEAGALPDREPDGDGEVQRGAGEGRRNAGCGGASRQLERQAGEVLGRESGAADGRAVHGNQGADRGVLGVEGEVGG